MFISTIVLLASATLGLCAPHPIPKAPKTLSKRSGTCRISGWDNNSNTVSGGGSTAGGAGISWNSASGIGVYLVNDDGSTSGLWSGEFGEDDNSNPLDVNGQTIPSTSTDLAGDIFYMPTYSGGSWVGCTCTYNGQTSDGDISGDVYTGVFYNEDNSECNCDFPCDMPTYAPGYCGAHIVQHQKADPAVDSYSYDVSLYDNNHVLVGSITGVNIAAQETYDMTSGLPYTFRLGSGNIDDDPVSLAYAGFIFDSNSDVCNVGLYDSGARSMDCGFAC